MNQHKYLQDIKHIKDTMDRSTRFISLSGTSGILAGIYALAGAGYFYYRLFYYDVAIQELYGDVARLNYLRQNFWIECIVVAVMVLALSLLTAFTLSNQKAKKHGQQLWSSQSLRVMRYFCIPFVAGGLFTIALLWRGEISLIAPAMLLFYGLSCFAASPFTLGTIKYLGITCMVLGLTNMLFPGYGLLFWALGFGVCHIVYGAIMHFKYDRSPENSIS